MLKNNICILGGGVAGLSAAFHIKELGEDSIVFEASNRVGGLLKGFTINGFYFDNAVHLSFTKDEYVKNIFDKTPHLAHKPIAYCVEDQVWLKHPVQNNLFPLPLDEKIELIKSFFERPDIQPNNYEEWLQHQYGKKISSRFHHIYTQKYWCHEPSQMSISWIGDRVRCSCADELLSGALEERCENHFYASEMRYPKEGGYFSFIKDLVSDLNIQTRKRVENISLSEKKLTFSDASQVGFEHLISSLPLPIIISLIDEAPFEVKKAASCLKWTTVDLISIGVKTESISPHLWFYIYDDDILASRAYSPSLKSNDNSPDGCSSIQFEIYNASTSKKYSSEQLIENCKYALKKFQLCELDDVLFYDHKHLPFGNVVFDLGMEKRRDTVINFLNKHNIYSCGRFGEWDYFWSDQSFMSGKKAAEQVIYEAKSKC
ncbi:FAD-dependent oxidoreductase [Catenovulum sp. SM1970]|uniref:protoporphyrinogen/coproporphyrinogen oxidase n=1 Tax=Marinifaba aquimaris TaxID=2741323 RepID=UPI0015717B88|nr:FAD-dependent oxidoreductase [Marinifaba aquimaris]NTS75350.1 FAD-dependent oxidoreductase [Marinifaba aquimaris]